MLIYGLNDDWEYFTVEVDPDKSLTDFWDDRQILNELVGICYTDVNLFSSFNYFYNLNLDFLADFAMFDDRSFNTSYRTILSKFDDYESDVTTFFFNNTLFFK